MALKEDVLASLVNTFNAEWNIRDGKVVPDEDDVTLRNGGVRLNAVFLYADMWDSTELVLNFSHTLAAKIVKAYLSCMSTLIKYYGGEIRSFDGDRVMGVWLVGGKNTDATECALHMAYAVDNILRPLAEKYFPELVEKNYVIRHCVGIDSSSILVVKAGIRDDNDLVFVGRAPNFAAKLSAIREKMYNIYISRDVHDSLLDSSRYKITQAVKTDMWESVYVDLAGQRRLCYRSSWNWRFN